MTDLIKAAQSALSWIHYERRSQGMDEPQAERDLRAALASTQSQGEPVATGCVGPFDRKRQCGKCGALPGEPCPLYAAPPAQPAIQDIVKLEDPIFGTINVAPNAAAPGVPSPYKVVTLDDKPAQPAEPLSMSMFATKADYEKAAQPAERVLMVRPIDGHYWTVAGKAAVDGYRAEGYEYAWFVREC